MSGSGTTTPTNAVQAIVLGSGPDTVSLRISEDAYQGDAQFTLSVDGQQIGGVQTATASHAAGADQLYVVQGSFGTGTHVLKVDFLNDSYGGTSGTDRNLYVDQVSSGNLTNNIPTALYTPGPVYLNFVTPACYCRGTLIQTERGETPVEMLAIGDILTLASGHRRPVRWVGQRSYAGRFLRANPGVQPVRFRAGCLGGGLPRRDLLVSPQHAMFLDGALVAARCLVNGSTIVRELDLDQVDYFHVELDSHDVLLAEGAPSESFVDDDSRAVFHNMAEWERMHPRRKHVPAVFCAPRVESGPLLEAIRQRLDEAASRVALAA